MNRIAVFLTLLAFLLILVVSAETIAQTTTSTTDRQHPEWTPFEQAMAEAQESGKKVLVAVYVDWCNWCKRLDEEVYTDSDVRAYLAENFIATRVDGEGELEVNVRDRQMSESELARALGTTGYPNTVFMNEEGDYITRLPGFLDAENFLTVLRYIGEEAYLSQSFEEFSGQ